MLYYAETYEYSVYTDDKGQFKFDKPTQYCSISVVLDTLPANYGISKQTQFIIPSNTSINIELSVVSDVCVVMQDGNLTPIIYNLAGDTIFAPYTLIPLEGTVVSSAMSAEKKVLSLKHIDNISFYNRQGIVKIGSNSYPYVIEDNLNDVSLLDKINILCDQGYLTESEKISLYCDLLKNDIGYVIQSGTTIYSEIMEYRDKNSISLSSDVSRKINEVADISVDPTYTDYIEATIGTYKIRVFYDASENMQYSVVSNFVSECISVYNFFVTNNHFRAPLPYNDTLYYPIYLVPDDYMPYSGVTTSYPSSGKSKIYVRYSQAAGSASDYK